VKRLTLFIFFAIQLVMTNSAAAQSDWRAGGRLRDGSARGRPTQSPAAVLRHTCGSASRDFAYTDQIVAETACGNYTKIVFYASGNRAYVRCWAHDGTCSACGFLQFSIDSCERAQ
jgi:hypothetical protein